jgi:predicted DsbA family dithiol-disulfide isomerase
LKKDEKKKESKIVEKKQKEKKKKQDFPLTLAALLVVFGLVAGAAIFSVFLAKPQALPNNSANTGSYAEAPLEMKTIYNSDCKVCLQQSSIELLLEQRNIKFKTEKLDMKVKENGVLAGTLGMTSFPSTIINAKQLKTMDLEVYNALKAVFPITGDYFVVPEKDLMAQTKALSAIMFLEAPTKERCGVTKGTIKLTEFFAFSSAAAFNAQSMLTQLKKDFNSTIEIEEKPLAVFGEANALPTIATMCAKQQGKFSEMKDALFEAKFKQSKDISDANAITEIAAKVNGLDLNALNICLDSNSTKKEIETDLNAATAYGLAVVPSYILDCIFVLPNEADLKQKICAFHSDFNACKK